MFTKLATNKRGVMPVPIRLSAPSPCGASDEEEFFDLRNERTHETRSGEGNS
jgi:hypothetical protein